MTRCWRHVWSVDTEYYDPSSEHVRPHCLVAVDLVTGRVVRLAHRDLTSLRRCPFSIGPDDLVVAYNGCAEIGVFIELGWAMPANLIDLYVEFVIAVNGYYPPRRYGMRQLNDALQFYGLRHPLPEAEKTRFQKRAGSTPPPLPEDEEKVLVAYCEGDSRVTGDLYYEMKWWIPEDQALLRGRSVIEFATIENRGIPLDPVLTRLFVERREMILARTIREVGAGEEIFEGKRLNTKSFFRWVEVRGLLPTWPKTSSGMVSMSEETFDVMKDRHPEVALIAEIMDLRASMKKFSLPIGADARHRARLRPFWTETGRCQPEGNFIFLRPSWWRGLIKPAPDTALGYIDYRRQEFGILAGLSGDPKMCADYRQGDPYLALAYRFGLISATTPKAERAAARERCKNLNLGINYGMGFKRLAISLGCSVNGAVALLDRYWRIYVTVREWGDNVVAYARARRELHTRFGFMRHVNGEARDNELVNWPVQSLGGEILRWAIILLGEKGIRVITTVHDAVLIEHSLSEINEAVLQARKTMADVAEAALNGVLRIETDADVTRYPRRVKPSKGVERWRQIHEWLR